MTEPADRLAAILGAVPLFSELAENDLAQIAARARIEDVAAGTVVIAEGSAPDAMYVVVEGELAVEKQGQSSLAIALNTCGPGDLLGELGVLAGRPTTATVTARTPSRLVVLDLEALHDLLRKSLAATLSILRTVAARLDNTEAVLRQHDTLAGLGRIAAGLAHELNNPAAAVARGAAELPERLDAAEDAAFRLRGLDPDQLAAVQRLALTDARPSHSAIERARRERALEEALQARGLDKPWELAPALAELGWDVSRLGDIAKALERNNSQSLEDVLRWIVTSSSARSISRDITDGATRISELVAAVKANSRLGEAPVQAVDVHAGLDSAVALLRHRLGNIAVRKDYGELPSIQAHGSELNQVWTNLIDNAAHAMAGTGELDIVTRRDGDHVVVEIIDSGPGIPAEVRAEIWKPFFTTKDVGEGTGLGLHLARNVVVHRHRGTIDVESRPGRTCFRVVLPVS